MGRTGAKQPPISSTFRRALLPSLISLLPSPYSLSSVL
jgi:hypothetical protein